MDESAIVLKGTAQGILLKPHSLEWNTVLESLERSLKESAGFFRGGRLIMELGERGIDDDTIHAVRSILEYFDIELWAILSDDRDTMRVVRSQGILTRLPKTKDRKRREAPEALEKRATFIQRTLRSGQKIQYAGHVTLIGDVNDGAEIVAGGNIIVWGTVRGTVHAGAFGDESAVVCAMALRPTILRIAGAIASKPEKKQKTSQPEKAVVIQGQIVVKAWNTRG